MAECAGQLCFIEGETNAKSWSRASNTWAVLCSWVSALGALTALPEIARVSQQVLASGQARLPIGVHLLAGECGYKSSDLDFGVCAVTELQFPVCSPLDFSASTATILPSYHLSCFFELLPLSSVSFSSLGMMLKLLEQSCLLFYKEVFSVSLLEFSLPRPQHPLHLELMRAFVIPTVEQKHLFVYLIHLKLSILPGVQREIELLAKTHLLVFCITYIFCIILIFCFGEVNH